MVLWYAAVGQLLPLMLVLALAGVQESTGFRNCPPGNYLVLPKPLSYLRSFHVLLQLSTLRCNSAIQWICNMNKAQRL